MDLAGATPATGKQTASLTEAGIRAVVAEHARLPVDAMDIGEWDDLFRLGLTSHASVNVMLALEDAFDVEFPEAMLRKSVFESIGAMREAITSLLASERR